MRKLGKIITEMSKSFGQKRRISSEKPNHNIKECNKSVKIKIVSTAPSTRARVTTHSTTTTQLRGATITSSGAAATVTTTTATPRVVATTKITKLA